MTCSGNTVRIQFKKACRNCSGLSAAKPRLKVSWEGMPLGNSRNVANQSRLTSPNSAISSQDSAPQMTAQLTITRISINRCKRVRSTRGSSTWAKCSFNAKSGEDSMCQPHFFLLHEGVLELTAPHDRQV